MSTDIRLSTYDPARDEAPLADLMAHSLSDAFPDRAAALQSIGPLLFTSAFQRGAEIRVARTQTGDMPRGFYVLFRERGLLDQLWVATDAQSQGIGTKLLQAAKEHGGDLTLITPVENVRGRRFYERNGFVAREVVSNPHGGGDCVLYGWNADR